MGQFNLRSNRSRLTIWHDGITNALMTQGDADTRIAACRLAIERAGGVAAMARQLGISIQAVAQWKIVPHGRARAVEEISGVPRRVLRPDIYDETPMPTQATGVNRRSRVAMTKSLSPIS
jgi:DNA-binding transcriptional regulator YdaS (Cro superfamily)